jgi:uncharacterized protein
MHLSGETEIEASRQRVWETISNPSRATAENSQAQVQIEKVDDTHFKIAVAAATPMMPVNVVLDLTITEAVEPTRIAATISGSVMGGPIAGTGHIVLTETAPKSTHLSWEADASLGGLLGGFEPMISGPIQSASEQAIEGLKERLEEEERAAG